MTFICQRNGRNIAINKAGDAKDVVRRNINETLNLGPDGSMNTLIFFLEKKTMSIFKNRYDYGSRVLELNSVSFGHKR
jgi:hypothetical protein